MQEYIMLVSDGGFYLDPAIKQQLQAVAHRRPQLHTISVAVGGSVDKAQMSLIACLMNGLYFHIPPIKTDERWSLNDNEVLAHESYVMSAMNEYFHMVAAPLARNHSILNGMHNDPTKTMSNLSLDVTWSQPVMDSTNEAVVITIALPCFGDSDK